MTPPNHASRRTLPTTHSLTSEIRARPAQRRKSGFAGAAFNEESYGWIDTFTNDYISSQLNTSDQVYVQNWQTLLK